ncbi:uncharacterized protein TNCV_3648061 [Trichonephila clavipes]|nr:uncharacterized protein TNCV_3648061 [Trichonephila clavipes]
MDCGSVVVRVSDHGMHVMSSSPVPLKTRRVGQRCTLNLSRAETSSRWCGVVVRRGGASSGDTHVPSLEANDDTSHVYCRRPTGIVVSDADFNAVGTGFEDMDVCKCKVPLRTELAIETSHIPRFYGVKFSS